MAEATSGGPALLRFFGLDGRARAVETCTWVLPYLGAFLLALLMLSVLVQRFFPLPVWVHVLAIVLAAVNCFLLLARIRVAALKEEENGESDDGEGSDEEDVSRG